MSDDTLVCVLTAINTILLLMNMRTTRRLKRLIAQTSMRNLVQGFMTANVEPTETSAKSATNL